MEIVSMIHGGESPYDVIFHVAQWLEKASGEPGYAQYVEDAMRAVYGCALMHVRPMEDELRDVEARHGLDRTREPVTRCVDVFSEWGSGAGLDACLRGSRMSAGDFVNAARRLIDLLGQMAAAGEGTWIGPLAREARTRTRRKEVM